MQERGRERVVRHELSPRAGGGVVEVDPRFRGDDSGEWRVANSWMPGPSPGMTGFLGEDIDPMDLYSWLKALHVIAIIAWMAGMLYLPRLYVYHCKAKPGSEMSETFKVMERRLLRAIINPAMIAAMICVARSGLAVTAPKATAPKSASVTPPSPAPFASRELGIPDVAAVAGAGVAGKVIVLAGRRNFRFSPKFLAARSGSGSGRRGGLRRRAARQRQAESEKQSRKGQLPPVGLHQWGSGY